MTIPFSLISPTTRVPAVSVEIDASQAGYSSVEQKTLIIAPMLAAGAGAADTLYQITTAEEAADYFGRGSIMHRMVMAYRNNDSLGTLYCIGVDDPVGAQSSGTFPFAGAATADGTVVVYVDGVRFAVDVASGDAAAAIATAVTAAINADDNLAVTAAAAVGTVTCTARHDGTIGDDTDLRHSFQIGEELPAGVTCTVTAMAAGAGAHDITAAVAAMVDEPFDWIIVPFRDSSNLTLLETELAATVAGRWGPSRQLYGHVFTANDDTRANNTTLGNANNDPALTIFGYYDSPTPVWEWAAAHVGALVPPCKITPARPFQTLAVAGVWAPPIGSRYTKADREILLTDGIATSVVSADGTVRIERVITTYQTNPLGGADTAWLDYNIRAISTILQRELIDRISTVFARTTLVNDGARANPGEAICTPKMVRGEILALYDDWLGRVLVEDADTFADELVVERNGTDPNRVDVLFPPNLANQGRIFAILNRFKV